jgi:hypothetical protein
MNTVGDGGVLDVLFSGRAISIDETGQRVGESGLRMGTSNIPTVEYLQRSVARSDPSQIVQEAIDSGRKIKFLAADIETGGVGPFDLARSVAAQTYELPTDRAGATVDDVLSAIGTQRGLTSNKIDFHMLLPEMQTITSGQRGASSAPLGLRTAMKESGFNPDRIMDLATPEGRQAAARSYEELFTQIVDPDTFLVGNNIAGFDIPKLMSSAASLEEFTSDSSRAQLLELVAEKANSDKVIDVTDVAGRHLFGRLQSLQAAGGSVEEIIERSTLDLLSPESLLKAGIEGEGVKPRSIESIVLSSNLLERLAESGPEGRRAIQQLASGNHVADIDQFMSMSILREVFSDNLDLLSVENRGIIPDALTLGITETERDTLVSNIGSARIAVNRATAVVPTANIASIDEISDQVFGFLMGPNSDEMLSGFEGLQAGARVKQVNAAGEVTGYIQYNRDLKAFEEVSTLTGIGTEVGDDYALTNIRAAMQYDEGARIARASAVASGAPLPPQVEPRVLSLGINQTQAGQMESTLRYISDTTGIGTSVRSAGMEAALATEAGQEAFIESMSATRRFTGMPHLQEQPSLVSRLISPTMRGRFDVPTEAAARQASQALHLGGAGLAMMDQSLRSNFVAISSLTSNLAFEGGNQRGALRIAEAIKRAENPAITEAEMTAHLSSLTREQIDSLNTRALQMVDYTSEMGVSSAKVTRSTSLITMGGPNAMTVGKPRISQSFLREMRVMEPGTGSAIPVSTSFLDSEFYKASGLNRAHLSIVDEAIDSQNIVNVVMGSGSMSRGNAETFANSVTDVVRGKYTTGANLDELVEQGFASSKQEADYLYNLVQAGDEERLAREFTSPLTQRLMDSGPVIGSIEGEAGKGVKAVVHSMSGTAGNDRVAIQRGLQFDIAQMDDETVSITAALDKSAMAHAQSASSAVGDAITAESGASQLAAQTTVLAKAETDKGFRSRLGNALGRYGVDSGIGGTRYGAGRHARNEKIIEMTKKAKPYVYKGALAVAAFSAGYYLARRNRDNSSYDQTMQQQPTERPGLIQQANLGMQENSNISSTRRDPLVTSGVVGNLDRNKIGHTGMGPNKYNHLFGA